MSRLSRYRRKRRLIQFLIFIFGLAIFFTFVLTIGIDLLINLTLFISNKNNNPIIEDTYQSKNQLLLETPVSSDIPIATNTAELNFTIRATRDSILTVDVNGERTFEETIQTEDIPISILLKERENEIVVTSQDSANKKNAKTQVYTVTYMKNKPLLEITSPQDNSTHNSQDVFIEGKTDKQVVIHINNVPVIVTASQTFKHSVRLQEGENKIIVTATDQAGNIEEKVLTLRYEKPE